MCIMDLKECLAYTECSINGRCGYQLLLTSAVMPLLMLFHLFVITPFQFSNAKFLFFFMSQLKCHHFHVLELYSVYYHYYNTYHSVPQIGVICNTYLIVHSKTHEGEYYVVFISVSFSACNQVPYREYKCLIWSMHSVNIYYMIESSE